VSTTQHFPELAARVREQAELHPGMYGQVDFDAIPYRLATAADDASALPAWVADRAPFLADERLVELITTATMLGDVVADRYASLAGSHGVHGLVRMLRQACREGIDAVDDAPAELRALIEAMEATPDWIDMTLVDEGAAAARPAQAFLSPFVLRGAFIGTFTNTYAALPMALTGALSSKRAARRVHETASFFAVTTLPGALRRSGEGFEAAAMVRLMHSVVRHAALTRSDRWDLDVYGIPVPQVDQMPAGLITMYVLATAALRRGRAEWTRRERAIMEFSRYRCFLLGLPEELLPTTPQGVVDVFHARGALLRAGFDDDTCGELVRSTMAAYLQPTHSPVDRLTDAVERSWSKVAFCQAFCHGDRRDARRMGVDVSQRDRAVVGVTAPFVLGRFLLATRAGRHRALRGPVDRHAIRTIRRRLADYGTPAYTARVPSPDGA
jgi:hypothetical protein